MNRSPNLHHTHTQFPMYGPLRVCYVCHFITVGQNLQSFKERAQSTSDHAPCQGKIWLRMLDSNQRSPRYERDEMTSSLIRDYLTSF